MPSSDRIGAIGEEFVNRKLSTLCDDFRNVSKVPGLHYDFLVGGKRVQVKTSTYVRGIPIGNTSNAEKQIGSSYAIGNWDYLIVVCLNDAMAPDCCYIVPENKLHKNGSNVLLKTFNPQNFLQYRNQWDQLKGQGVMCSCEGAMRDMYCPVHGV